MDTDPKQNETLDGTLLDCAAVLARIQQAEEAERYAAADRDEIAPTKIRIWDPWR